MTLCEGKMKWRYRCRSWATDHLILCCVRNRVTDADEEG